MSVGGAGQPKISNIVIRSWDSEKVTDFRVYSDRGLVQAGHTLLSTSPSRGICSLPLRIGALCVARGALPGSVPTGLWSGARPLVPGLEESVSAVRWARLSLEPPSFTTGLVWAAPEGAFSRNPTLAQHRLAVRGQGLEAQWVLIRLPRGCVTLGILPNLSKVSVSSSLKQWE